MRAAIVAVLLLVAGCDAPAPAVKSEPVEKPEVPVQPEVTPVVAPVVTPEPEKPVVAEAPLPGVGPGGAEGREARRDAVLAVLGDGASAAEFKLIASDPGRVFDPDLVEEMTPTIAIEVTTIPAVRQKEAKVKGPLAKDLIRRIVRAHINELRYCYNQGLAKDPNLDGTITLDFQILATGKVGEGKVGKSTVPDAAVGECMVVAVKRWSFPKPEPEGTVEVSYPFEFSSDGARAERR